MSFSISPWFFLPVFAAGIWLAYRLYFDDRTSIPRRWRVALILLTVLVWFALAGLLVQPLWISASTTYHPPAIAIVLDESPSYGAGTTLQAQNQVQRSVNDVRKFYEAKGFRVFAFGFAESVHAIGFKGNVGTQTSLTVLHRYLDSLAIPNLQGVFMWTDGRWNLDTNVNLGAWPAPVFPVLVRGTGGEIQGENVQADLSEKDSGAEISGEWRSLGESGKKRVGTFMEIRSGDRILWKGSLSASLRQDSNWGVKSRFRFRIPVRSLQGVGEKWIALIRPEDKRENVTEKNDTVDVQFTGVRRKRHVFVRPLQSLEERGLVDALFASDSMEAVGVAPELLAASLRGKDVIWGPFHEAERFMRVSKKTGASLVLYRLFGESVERREPFSPAAHIQWRSDADRFFPGGVLNLADLGFASADLPSENNSIEPIAWAEEKGHRGVLVGIRKNTAFPCVEFLVPPLWSAQFQTRPDERILHLQQLWTQGVAGWAAFVNRGNEISKPGPAVRLANDIEMARLGLDDESLSMLALMTHGSLLKSVNESSTFNRSLPNLPQGQMREAPIQSRPLFPLLPSILLIVSLLCATWAARKKLHLD